MPGSEESDLVSNKRSGKKTSIAYLQAKSISMRSLHTAQILETKIFSETEILDHDILLAGFPCQSFSVAGLKKGFNDERGQAFFELERILKVKKPKVFLLENVPNLLADSGSNLFNSASLS